jgi:hypothetical protein
MANISIYLSIYRWVDGCLTISYRENERRAGIGGGVDVGGKGGKEEGKFFSSSVYLFIYLILSYLILFLSYLFYEYAWFDVM